MLSCANYSFSLDSKIRNLENHISSKAKFGIDFIDQMLQYSIRGGKCYRAKTAIIAIDATAHLNSISLNDHSKSLDIAAAIEMIQAASLLHDDVLDAAQLRRGQDSINIKFGNKRSILLGDLLFANAMDIVANLDNNLIVKIITQAMRHIITGEMIQTQNIGHKISKQTYYDLICKKTAKLFEVSTGCGYLIGLMHNKEKNYAVSTLNDLAQKEQKQLIYFQKLGLEIGKILQIADDILDIFGDTNLLGKETFNDFFSRKYTLPLILLSENSEGLIYMENSFSAIESDNVNKQDMIRNTGAIMRASNIPIQLLALLHSMKKEFVSLISQIPSPYHESLIELYDDIAHPAISALKNF